MNVISRFKESRFAKNVSVLIAGNLSAQLISVISLPILTRLFTASDFGLFATVTSVIAILGTVASLRYELAIPLPFSNKKAFNLFVISIIALVIISFLLLCVLLIAFLSPESFIESTELNSLLLFVPFGVILLGANNILRYCVIRSGSVNLLAKSLFLSELVKFSMQMLMVTQGAVGLVLASLIGSAVSLAYLFKSSTIRVFDYCGFVTKRSIKNFAAEYSSFPKYSTLAGLVNVGGQHLPNILIMYFYGAVEAGFFFLANKFLSVIITVSGTAFSHSFLIEAINKNNRDHLYKEVKKAVYYLTIIIIIPTVVLSLFGKEMIIFISGSEWEKSGELLSGLLFIIVAQFITSPVSQILTIKGKLKELLILQVILTLLKLTGVLLGFYVFSNYYMSVLLFSIFGSVGYLLLLSRVFYYSK